ncbi:MAG: TM2 domain-containing protein [Lachnospiraceae bacterium]|nr:TM2 domain-containing protein [Lachnospiraceae bacterium]
MMTRCSICGAPLSGRVCEYCGTKAQGTGSEGAFQTEAREWGRKAQDWGRQAGQQAQEWGREARDWGRDMKGRFTQRTAEPGTAASETARVSTRSKWIAFVLCLLLGRWGIHRLYAGKIGTGLLYMATKGFGFAGVVMDLILILTNNFTDGEGRPLRK